MKATEEYLDLPYHYILESAEDDQGTTGWFITVAELPGCMSQGETPDEAVTQIRDAMLGWISVMQEDERPIPEPRDIPWDGLHRFVQLPDGLHERIETLARREGVDVETFVLAALSVAVGWPQSAAQPEAVPAAG